jgi:hypothetical protein
VSITTTLDPHRNLPSRPRAAPQVPRSLEQLVWEAGRLAAAQAAAAEAAASLSVSPSGETPLAGWRLVAGHTGHGIFKDWPLEEAVLLSVAEVRRPDAHACLHSSPRSVLGS